MRVVRFSIAGLMGAVLIAAVGLAALRNASQAWDGAMILLTYAVLGLAILCAILRGRAERAWWLGICVFGWGYLALVARARNDITELPTTTLLEAIGPWFSVSLPPSPFEVDADSTNRWNPWYVPIGQSLCTLLAALLGGILAGLFFASRADRSESGETGPRPTVRPPRKWWHRLTIAALAGLVLAGSVATIRSRSAPGFWAGATFFLACGLIGLTCLGAIFGRDRRRAADLGAAVFGGGYMLLVFASSPYPTLPTGSFLSQLRPWFPPIAIGAGPANARVLEALDRPIPMHFPNETPLRDVLTYIKQATATPTDRGISIYVDLVRLVEGDRNTSSTVSIDADGLPLKTTLHLVLRQLDLDFSVQDGYVMITSEDHAESDLEDPFLIVGHCLLALIAAGLGGLAAPFVARAHRVDDIG